MERFIVYFLLFLNIILTWPQQLRVVRSFSWGSINSNGGSADIPFTKNDVSNRSVNKSFLEEPNISVPSTYGKWTVEDIKKLVRESAISILLKNYLKTETVLEIEPLRKKILQALEINGLSLNTSGQEPTEKEGEVEETGVTEEKEQNNGNKLQQITLQVAEEEIVDMTRLFNAMLVHINDFAKDLNQFKKDIQRENEILKKEKLFYSLLNGTNHYEQCLQEDGNNQEACQNKAENKKKYIEQEEDKENFDDDDEKENMFIKQVETVEASIKHLDYLTNDLLIFKSDLEKRILDFSTECSELERYMIHIIKMHVQHEINILIHQLLKSRYEFHLLLESKKNLMTHGNKQNGEQKLYEQDEEEEKEEEKDESGKYELIYGDDEDIFDSYKNMEDDSEINVYELNENEKKTENNLILNEEAIINDNEVNITADELAALLADDLNEALKELEMEENGVSKEELETEEDIATEEELEMEEDIAAEEELETEEDIAAEEKQEMEEDIALEEEQTIEDVVAEEELEMEDDDSPEEKIETKEDVALENEESGTNTALEKLLEVVTEENADHELEEIISEGNIEGEIEKNLNIINKEVICGNDKEQCNCQLKLEKQNIGTDDFDNYEHIYENHEGTEHTPKISEYSVLENKLVFYSNYLKDIVNRWNTTQHVNPADISEISENMQNCLKCAEELKIYVNKHVGIFFQNHKNIWEETNDRILKLSMDTIAFENIMKKLGEIDRLTLKNILSSLSLHFYLIGKYMKTVMQIHSFGYEQETKILEDLYVRFTKIQQHIIELKDKLTQLNIIYEILSQDTEKAYNLLVKSKKKLRKFFMKLYSYVHLDANIAEELKFIERLIRATVYHEELKESFIKVRKIWKKYCLSKKKSDKKKGISLLSQFKKDKNILFPPEFGLEQINLVSFGKTEEMDKKANLDKENDSNVMDLKDTNTSTDIDKIYNSYVNVLNKKIVNPYRIVFESVYFKYIYNLIMKKYYIFKSENEMILHFYAEYRSLDPMIAIISSHRSNLKFLYGEIRKKILSYVQLKNEILEDILTFSNDEEIISKILNKISFPLYSKREKERIQYNIRFMQNFFDSSEHNYVYLDNLANFIEERKVTPVKWKQFLLKNGKQFKHTKDDINLFKNSGFNFLTKHEILKQLS